MPHTYWNTLSGLYLAQSPILGANTPVGLAMYGVENEYLIVVDLNNKRLVNLQNINSPKKNITVIFNSWNNGSTLNNPAHVIIDLQHANDVYVMQTINLSPKAVAGVCGTTPNKLNGPKGIFFDSE
jgi:hypothetical protein